MTANLLLWLPWLRQSENFNGFSRNRFHLKTFWLKIGKDAVR